MNDPRMYLIVGTLLAALWVGQKVVEGTVDGTKFVAQKTKCAVIHLVGKHCEKPTQPTQP